MYVTKNYRDTDKWTVGGELNVLTGGKITSNDIQAAAIANHVDPAVATNTEIATKQNAILNAIRGAGIIA